jgi:hypothetical protein
MTKLEELKTAWEVANAAAAAAWGVSEAASDAYQAELDKPRVTKLKELKAAYDAAWDAADEASDAFAAYEAASSALAEAGAFAYYNVEYAAHDAAAKALAKAGAYAFDASQAANYAYKVAKAAYKAELKKQGKADE